MNIQKKFYKVILEHRLHLLVIGIFSIIGSLPFFHEGLYTAHDIWHQVARMYHYTEALRDGQLFPTWISTLSQGHGYPLFLFSYHMPWLIGGPIALLGFDIQGVLKLLFVGSFFASGISAYAFGWHVTKQKVAALTAAILYLFAPYHFLTMYVSAAIGTQFQFAILPLMFLGSAWIFDRKPRIGVVLLSLATAAGILSHLITFAFMFGSLLLYVAFSFAFNKVPAHRKKKVLTLLLYSVFLGLALSSFYIVPFFSYSKTIIASMSGNGFTDIYKSNFVTFKQLVYSKWGFGPIISNAKDGEISLQIGIAQWIGTVSASILATLYLFKKRKTETQPLFFVLLFLLAIVGMLDISNPLWVLVTKSIAFDYPFRLLLIAVFAGSIATAYFVAAFKHYKYIPITLSVLIVVIALYTNRNHVRVNLYTNIENDLYVRSETTTNTFHEYLPKGVDTQLLAKEAESVLIAQATPAAIKNIHTTSNSLSFDVELSTSSAVSLRQFSFPGQSLYVDSNYVPHEVDSKGRIATTLQAGSHTILVRYEDTTPILLGKVITVLGLLFCIRFVITESRKK